MQDAENNSEFQTCGAIMVAVRTKAIAVACNFCQQTFIQLPAFMRHLQLQHNDKLKFTKQTKEVEVYAFEELLNQTTNSSVANIITEEHNSTEDDAAWLSEHDIKWLHEGIAPNKQEDAKLPNIQFADDDETNLSVLTTFDNIKNTSVSEPKKITDLDNTLLKEIRNEWEHNDTISSLIDSCDTQMLNSFNKRENIELDTQHLIYNRVMVDTLDKIKENLQKSTRAFIKSLLENLENNVADIEKICKTSANLSLNFTDINNSQLEANNFGPKKVLYKNKASEGINCNYESDNLGLNDLLDNSKEEKETDQILSEDLTKVLADALDNEVLDLLNIPPAEDIENILDTDMINLLENQSLDKENETTFKELNKNNTKKQSKVLRAPNANNFTTKNKVPNEKLLLSKESTSVRDSCSYFKENMMPLAQLQQFASNKMKSPTKEIIFKISPKSQETSIEHNNETPINFNMKTTGEEKPQPKSSRQIKKNTSTPKRAVKKHTHAPLKKLSVKLENLTLDKLHEQCNKPKRKFFKRSEIFGNRKQIGENSTIQSVEENYNLMKTQIHTTNNLELESTCIDVLPPSQGNCKIQERKPTDKNLPNINLKYKNFAINRSTSKNEAIQRMRNIKKQIVKSLNADRRANENNIKAENKKSPFIIENIQILPKLKTDVITSIMSTASANLSLGNETSSITQDAHLLQKSLKRSASYPLLNEQKQTKLQHKSLNQEQVIEKICKEEVPELDLSENAQQDEKVDRLNIEKTSAESTVLKTETEDTKYENSDNSIINDLLKEVSIKVKEKQIENAAHKQQSDNLGTNPDAVVDFDDIKDNELLAKFGLKIIKIPEIEDAITLEERDELYEKACKFANIYKNYQRVWLVRHATMKLDLNKSFNELLIAVNLAFNFNLSLVELKRLTNLINLWYANNFSSKLIDKYKISESTNRYLLLYHFIPKTSRRLIFCEYCEENFNTEHKYFKHRITHTGALYPYYCGKCVTGFTAPRYLRNHQCSCNLIENNKMIKTQPSTSYSRLTPQKNKCLVCTKMFATSELLYEHSKTHLKCVYKCYKCKLVFASAIDAKRHISMCKSVSKNILKQNTPPHTSKPKSYTKNDYT